MDLLFFKKNCSRLYIDSKNNNSLVKKIENKNEDKMIVIMNTNILFTVVPGIISKGYNILNHLFYKVQSSFQRLLVPLPI